MVRFISRLVSILFSIVFWMPAFADTMYVSEVADDTGTQIKLAQPAKRIVSLAPDITEILFAIGAGPHIVGVIKGSDSPVAARNITKVGDYSGIDVEKIIELHPDLIITWGLTFSRQLSIFKELHIPVYTTEPHQLEDIPKTMQSLGELTGLKSEANKVVNNFKKYLVQLRQRYQSEKPIKVFYQIGGYGLMTINKDSWINQIITLCGGQNVFVNAKTIAPEVNWEAIVAANPDVVIASSEISTWKNAWQKWPEIAAVRQQYLFTINPDLIERAGPRILEGATQMCEYLERGRGKTVLYPFRPQLN